MLQQYGVEYEGTLGEHLQKRNPEKVFCRCGTALSCCCGRQGHELQALKLDDIHETEDGIWVDYEYFKQKWEVKGNKFVIPFNRNNPSLCFAT